MEYFTWIVRISCNIVIGCNNVIGDIWVKKSSKKDHSFLCSVEFVMNSGVASDKGICTFWVFVCVDSRDVMNDAAGGECTESDDVFVLLLYVDNAKLYWIYYAIFYSY